MRSALLLLLFALPAAAQTEPITFHVRFTDARTALLTNPKLQVPEEHLRRAARDRVILLQGARGARWNWLMLSWLPGKPDAEHGLNVSGSTSIDKDADFTLSVVDERTLRVRCLHEQCALTTSRGGEAAKTRTLTKGETALVSFDSDVAISW